MTPTKDDTTTTGTSTQPVHIHPDALKGLITLREAGVFKNKVDVNPDRQHLADAWAPILQCDPETGLVTFLDLGGCRLRKGIPHGEGVPEVLASLQALNLGGTDLPLAAEIVVLQELQLLETLHLGGNGLDDAGVILLARQYLPTARNLKALDLRYNNIGPTGCEALCEGLSKQLEQQQQQTSSVGLQRLYLEGNQVGDSGAVALASWLELEGNPLKELFLGANTIGAEGACALARALKHNKTITKLYLEGNKIGPSGGDAFARVLTECNGDTALKHLFCDNNDIGKETSKRLAKALNSATAIGDPLVE